MKISPIALLTTALALAAAGSPALAGGFPSIAMSGGYASVFGGYALGTTLSGSVNTTPTAGTLSIPLSGGYNIGATVGAEFFPNLRGEVELSFSGHAASGTATAIVGGTTTTITTSGNVSTAYLLGNIWYDVDTGSPFTPYVGAGLGLANITPNLTLATGGGSFSYQTSSLSLAGQFGAGVKFKVADSVSLDLGYRLKDVVNGSLAATPSSNPTLSSATYVDQSIQLGVLFHF